MPEIRPLSENLQRIAIAELNEVPERLDADIAALRTWLTQQPHLRSRTDDQFLVGFLRGCKFSLEKAKSKLDRYYTLRSQFPDSYTIRDVDSERVLDIIKLGVGLRLPLPLNDDGPRLIYVRPGAYPTDKFSFEQIMAVSNAMNALSLQHDDYAAIYGYMLVLDFSEYTAAHMLQMTPGVAKRMSKFTEDAMPVRERGIHMININSVFEKGINLLRSLMPLKQQQRISVHGSNLESLYEHVPKRYLPAHLGGEQGSIEELKAQNLHDFLQFRDFLREESNYGADEKLRPGGKCTDYESLFGVEGSFRKLNFD